MATDIEMLNELVQNSALLTEHEIQAIAYPHAPGTAKRPPSYVSAVAHEAAVKVVKRGYRLVDVDKDKRLEEVCILALERWGVDDQRHQAIEELAELIVELSHMGRTSKALTLGDLAGEIADVQLMLSQMTMAYKLEERVERAWAYTLKRLEQRLKKWVRAKDPHITTPQMDDEADAEREARTARIAGAKY